MAHYKRIQRKVASTRRELRGRLAELEGMSAVRIIDDSEYEAGMCCNGGHYRFFVDYRQVSPGVWSVQFGTTAEFDFCELCGSFGQHHHADWAETSDGWELDEWWECGDGSLERISTGALLEEILRVERSDQECRYSPGEAAEYWKEMRA
jgi:hypothetical protein